MPDQGNLVGDFQVISIRGEGEARCYVARPAAAKAPGIVLLSEILGVNFHLRSVADYFAALGYVVYAPNVFWRWDPIAENDYSKPGLDRGLALLERSNDAQMVKDLATVIDTLRRDPGFTGKVAAVGYCMGGRLGYLCGTERTVDAVIALYPTWIERVLDRADRAVCPMSMHIPEVDSLGAHDAIERITATFTPMENVELFLYPGVHHGFDSDHKRQVYDRFASQLANSRAALFLARTIGAASG